jgi:hypothetical protein
VNTVGIILDGSTKVGTFDNVCTIVGGRMREIRNVEVMEQYVDISRGHTNRDLLFLYMEKLGDKTFSLLDCIGFGKVYGSMWCNGSYVRLDNANFLGTVKEGKDAN